MKSIAEGRGWVMSQKVGNTEYSSLLSSMQSPHSEAP